MKLIRHNLIVVTSVYEDAEASGRLFRELSGQFRRDIFVVAVDDGSVKQPWDIGSRTCSADELSQILFGIDLLAIA